MNRSKGVRLAREMVRGTQRQKRMELGMSALTIAVECGASDFTSAIAANPAVGAAVDRLIEEHGTVIFSETTEVIAAEHLLIKRISYRSLPPFPSHFRSISVQSRSVNLIRRTRFIYGDGAHVDAPSRVCLTMSSLVWSSIALRWSVMSVCPSQRFGGNGVTRCTVPQSPTSRSISYASKIDLFRIV